jgi:hypothetical protein
MHAWMAKEDGDDEKEREAIIEYIKLPLLRKYDK